MTDQEQLIRKVARELQTASHQAKDDELSDLVRDLRRDFAAVMEDVARLREDFSSLEKSLHSFDIKFNNTEHVTSDHEKRLTRSEKAQMTVAGVILLAVLYSWLRQIGL